MNFSFIAAGRDFNQGKPRAVFAMSILGLICMQMTVQVTQQSCQKG